MKSAHYWIAGSSPAMTPRGMRKQTRPNPGLTGQQWVKSGKDKALDESRLAHSGMRCWFAAISEPQNEGI